METKGIRSLVRTALGPSLARELARASPRNPSSGAGSAALHPATGYRGRWPFWQSKSNEWHVEDAPLPGGCGRQLRATGADGQDRLDNPDDPHGPVIPNRAPMCWGQLTVKTGQESSSLRMAPRKPRVDSAASLMPSESTFLANDRMRTCV